jgi:hypothetical protein
MISVDEAFRKEVSPAHATSERLLHIYLTLGQYPVLRGRIRKLMREELFERSIIARQEFESKVHSIAVETQENEGLEIPQQEESADLWELRLLNVRDQLTDIMFSLQLPEEEFELIVNKVLDERGIHEHDLTLSINPELASRDLVFSQAKMIENMPKEERAAYEPRLEESKVVLIRSMISDQLPYIHIAKEWFSITDLEDIRQHKIGAGRIGGKAAGMLLAYKILVKAADERLKTRLRIPQSFYIGATEYYPFMTINNLTRWLDQKYKSEAQMRADYPEIIKDFEAGKLPEDVQERLLDVLVQVGKKPLIVRSSSLLEDSFGTAFAGKYKSVFLPNQGTMEQNLEELVRGIARVYASSINPNALLYRRQRGLLDYDERMAVLIQVVEGERLGNYFLPQVAGVAFSRNVFRWAPQIKAEGGFVRMVWGLGTRAVDRVGDDFPCVVALSHPLLRPNSEPESIRRYSQQFVDVIDLEEGEEKTLPIQDVMTTDYPPLRYLAQLENDGYFSTLHSRVLEGETGQLVLTLGFYKRPVDMEFTLHLERSSSGRPEVVITILQCRPQSHLMETKKALIPQNLKPGETIFSTRFVVPEGYIERVDYVLFIPPEGYFALPSAASRNKLVRTIGSLNAALAQEDFICIGPGRWGSSNSDLGVSADYGDIYNARALVEMAGSGIVPELEPSLGTHFFQDLMEGQIYPLGIFMDDPKTVFNLEFFNETPNHLAEWADVDDVILNALRLIRVDDFKPGHYLRIVMSSEDTHAIAFLTNNDD